MDRDGKKFIAPILKGSHFEKIQDKIIEINKIMDKQYYGHYRLYNYLFPYPIKKNYQPTGTINFR